MRNAPIVSVFIDWLYASLDEDKLPEPKRSAHTLLRSRSGRQDTEDK
jgi:LysR family transcriptional regulator, glycine cleavage system transcriptional activator